MVKGVQCHSNNLPQLFDVKKGRQKRQQQQQKTSGTSKDILHRFDPSLFYLRHAYCCSSRKSCVNKTNNISLLVKCLLCAIL